MKRSEMKRSRLGRTVLSLTSGLLVALCMAAAGADEGAADGPYPAAILGFQERGSGVSGYGEKVVDLLFALLATEPELVLVERAEIEKLLEEQSLSLSGVVRPDEAVKVGQLTGAKILVTGSVIEVEPSMYLVAKIIGTETSRVLGVSVKGKANDDLGSLVEKMASDIGKTMRERSGELVAKPVTSEDRVESIAKALGGKKRPTVWIQIEEEHIGQQTIDPAAETEMSLLCQATGFTVIDPKEGSRSEADVIIEGEAFSEFAVRRQDLISVKARVEVKAIDRVSGEIISSDRQTAVVVDLAEQIAGKTALQEASGEIAVRLLPKLARE